MWVVLARVVLAAAAVVVLLSVFRDVVRSSIEQGEARRATASQRDLAVWHCARVGGRIARDHCLSQIHAAMQDGQATVLREVAILQPAVQDGHAGPR